MDMLDEQLHGLVDELSATRPEPSTALVRVARGRRRRRRLTRLFAATVALAVVAAFVAAVVRDGTGTNRIESPAISSSTTTNTRVAVDDGGDTYTLRDLDDGSSRRVPLTGRVTGDRPFRLLRVDDFLVYVGDDGIQAQPLGASGTTISLGPASSFVPSARDGWIWLVTTAPDSHSAERVQEVRVDGTTRDSALELPPGMSALVGVNGGLLIGDDTSVVARWDQATGAVGPSLLEGTVGLVDARGDTAAWSLGCAGPSTCTLRVLDLVSGKQRDVTAPAAMTSGWIPGFDKGVHDSLSPDGRHLAVRAGARITASEPGTATLFVIDLDTGDVDEVPASASQGAYSPLAWSPDGRWLFYETTDHQLGAYAPDDQRALTYPGACCGVALVTMSSAGAPTPTTTTAVTTTRAPGTDVTTLQPTFEEQIARLEAWYHNWPAEAPGGRPVLVAEWTYCDYRGNRSVGAIPGVPLAQPPEVQATFSSYSKLSEPLTAARLADGCVNRADRFPGGTPANVPVETPEDELPAYVLCATDQPGPNHTGAPPARTVLKPAIVFGGADCASAGYQDPPTDFVAELDHRRHVEIELRAVPKACPSSEEALRWVRHVTERELGAAWETPAGGPETCYRPAYIDWDVGRSGLLQFTESQARGS